jgi:magnesium transporter
MNFDQIPELHWGYGYPFALVVMAVSVVALFTYFRRKGWI